MDGLSLPSLTLNTRCVTQPNQSDEDGKNMAIIHVFDKNSKLVLDNSWQENRDVPILVKSENPTSLKQSGQHYEFKCENYSVKREDTGRYMLGDRCQIISRGNGNTLRCLEAQGWGDAAEKGDVALAKCDPEIATQVSFCFHIRFWRLSY